MPDSNSSLPPLHRDLIKALEQKTLLPIVAAGVSMSVLDESKKAVFPSWTELLQRAATQLSESDEQSKKIANVIEAMLGVGNYQQAAEFARKGLKGASWLEFFDKQFDLELTTRDLVLPKAIWELSNSIITLNYDKVMESATNNMSVYDNCSTAELCNFAQNEKIKPELWHIHGRIDNKKDIIFTSESYDNLYKINQNLADNYIAAITRLKNLAANKNFLFIGCSMDDAELLEQLAHQNKIFVGSTGPHFVMVRKNDLARLEAKLINYDVNFVFIPYENFGQPLLDKVNQINQKKKSIYLTNVSDHALVPITDNAEQKGSDLNKNKQCKIAIFHPQMLDHQLDMSIALTELKKLKADLYFYPLNKQRLNELYDMDYIILLSETVSDGILFEDEFLCRQIIPFEDVIENIGNINHKGLVLLTDKALPNAVLNKIDEAVMVVSKCDKKTIGNFIFQVFNKHKKAFGFHTDLQCCALEKFELTRLPNQHKSKIIDCKQELPKDINPNILQHTVGRLDDIESIVRKIIKLTSTSGGGCLTIKGAGGLGKTTLAKKAVIALARDGRYEQGIYFIDASSMADFAEFEYKIMQPFGFEGMQDAQQQFATLYSLSNPAQQTPSEQRLIVLDNAETLKHLSDSNRIMSLLIEVCQYCTLISTSRELLGIEYGDPYELRQFSTDEAQVLFLRESHFKELSEHENYILRRDILEDLLDNHPLAVKLIAKAAVKGDSLIQLRDGLIESNELFENTDIVTSNHPGDANIERQESIFNCIAYSYKQLSIDERNIFKMLALFPDGLPSLQLKKISSDKQLNKNGEKYQSIKDQHIKALQNKSLIEENNGVQKLHAIVRRFSQEKINQDENAAILYKKAFKHIEALQCGLFSFGTSNYKNSNLRNSRASNMQNNLISPLNYFGLYDYDIEKQFMYIERLIAIMQACNCWEQQINALQNLPKSFIQDKQQQAFIEVEILWLNYFKGDFIRVINVLQKNYSKDQVIELDFSNILNRNLAIKIADIYKMEGDVKFSVEVYAKYLIASKGFPDNIYPEELFLLGEVDNSLLDRASLGFQFFEAQSISNNLDIDQLKEYFYGLYEKEHINRMQIYYLLSKVVGVETKILDSLLVVNPYTSGLKQLMLAWQQDTPEQADDLYKLALSNLFHIKYYYVEAQLYYCRFLKEQGFEKYTQQFNHGLKLAKTYNYRFLQHQFIQLSSGVNEPYNSNDYRLPEAIQIEEYKRLVLRDFKKN